MASFGKARLNLRLARRLDAVTEATHTNVLRRITDREHAAAMATLRAALAAAGIAPEGISAVRFYGEAEHRLADSAAAQDAAAAAADAAFIAAVDPARAARPVPSADVVARARDFIGHAPPDPGAAPIAWYAWALAALSDSVVASEAETTDP